MALIGKEACNLLCDVQLVLLLVLLVQVPEAYKFSPELHEC